MTSVSTRIRRVSGAVCAAAVAIVLLTATPASAHDNLTDAVPSAGETVTNLDTVALTFSGELIDFSQTSFAQVQGPDGLFYESSCSTIELNVLTTPVALGASGTYTVLWNAVSSDGHPISESYQFDYAADPTATVALGWDAPACGNEGTRTQPGAALTSTPMPTDAPTRRRPHKIPTESRALTGQMRASWPWRSSEASSCWEFWRWRPCSWCTVDASARSDRVITAHSKEEVGATITIESCSIRSGSPATGGRIAAR